MTHTKRTNRIARENVDFNPTILIIALNEPTYSELWKAAKSLQQPSKWWLKKKKKRQLNNGKKI